MPLTLYDLAGADPERRFSPYCWRIKFAIAHKGLDFETVPWRFTETEKLAFSGQGKVPVLVDDGRVVTDSWAIACYLEDHYPDRPSLFGGAGGRAHARFINAWTDSVMHRAMARLIVRDVVDVLAPADVHYFRTTRERAFGMPLEHVVADREKRVEEFRLILAPLRAVLKAQPWLGGDAPDYADYIVLGSLQWPRCTSRFQLIEPADPVFEWRARGDALFGGLGAKPMAA